MSHQQIMTQLCAVLFVTQLFPMMLWVKPCGQTCASSGEQQVEDSLCPSCRLSALFPIFDREDEGGLLKMF